MQQCCIVSSVRQERPADLFATKLLNLRLKTSRQQRKQPASDQFMLHFSITNLHYRWAEKITAPAQDKKQVLKAAVQGIRVS